MKKRITILAGLLCLLVLAGVFLWRATRSLPPASTDRIPLPDGSWVHLEAATYGTNHLVGPRLAMLASRMSPRMQMLMLRVFRKHAAMRFRTETPTPQLVLWLNRGPYANSFPASLGHLRCVITDTNGFTAGEEIYYSAPYPLEAKSFNIFPRRDPEFILKIYHHDLQGGVKECGQMRIANPWYRRYEEWQPHALPLTQKSGDVEATLKHVVANAAADPGARRLPDHSWQLDLLPASSDKAPVNICELELRSTTDSNFHWQVASVSVLDATGNRIDCGSLTWGGLGKDWISFSPGLWTNESAWKLVFGLKRTSGFRAAELLKFENVPLGELNQSNRLDWSTNAHGVALKLTSLLRRAPAMENLLSRSNLSVVEFELSNLTNRQHLDLVEAVTDDGTHLNAAHQATGRRGTNYVRTYQFGNIPRKATTASFTFAVQSERTVEFKAKPEVVIKPLQFKVEPE